MSKNDRQDVFNVWFNWHGHWIYADKPHAFRVWQERGIEGLPDWQPGCELAPKAAA